MNKKFTYEYVRDYIASFGYELLSKEYNNCRTRLKIKCDNGHEYKIAFTGFKAGVRCRVCSKNKEKLTYEYVRDYIASFGYVLLSNEYIDVKTKLKIKCDKGHEYNVKFNNFKSGRRCPFCYGRTNPTIKQALPEGVWKLNIALYDTYAHKLEPYGHKCSRDPENELILNVECAYCGKIHRPTRNGVSARIMSIHGNNTGDNNLYCSEECKQDCPVFKTRKYRKDIFNKEEGRFGSTFWRNIVLERDSYTCQKCGLVSPDGVGLEAHHYQDAATCAPALSCDVDNGVTLCISCHVAAHQIEGCTPQDIKEAS